MAAAPPEGAADRRLRSDPVSDDVSPTGSFPPQAPSTAGGQHNPDLDPANAHVVPPSSFAMTTMSKSEQGGGSSKHKRRSSKDHQRPGAKRSKANTLAQPKSAARGQHTPDLPRPEREQELGGPSSKSDLVGTSSTKQKRPTLMVQNGTQRTNPQKKSATKKFQPPMVTRSPIMVTRSPILRLLVSPLLVRSSCSPRSPPVLPSSPPQPGTHESAQSKPRKLRSEIWIDMEPIYGQGKVVKARCKHCYEVFSASRNSGNSHIRRHLAICEPRLKMVEMVENLKSSIPSIEAARLSNWKFDPKKTQAELVRLIVLHELPFSLVEYEGFRSYSASLNPLAESISRTTIKENCIQAFKNHRATIIDELRDSNCRFSLTADIWTCHNTTSYIVVTCHYIDVNWKVQKKIIKFSWIETPHDGFNIYSVMLKAIRFYGIEDKLCSITLDNASVNKTMMDLLKGHLVKMNMLHSSGDLFHVRCAAHVINLIVKDGLQEIDGAIYRIRESIRYIKGSPSRWEKFEEIIRDLRIKCKSRPSLDVATRWNSTCDMLESALPFKDAFIELEHLDSNYIYCPRPEEWHKAAVVCKLLKVFKKATKIVSGSKYPTANLYFHQIWNLKQVLDEEEINPNRTLLSMVLEMQNKFEKYWDISYLANCIPVILDPRFKFGFIEFRLKQVYGNSAGDHIAKVDKTLRNLFNGYSSEMGNTNSATQGETSTARGSNSWSDWFRHISAQNNQVSGELDRYLRDDLFPYDDESFDILHWWKVHASQYPVVACMARDLLAVPASTVASESAFSTSERIVNDHRTRLANNTVEALICFQDWLRSAGSSYLDIISITTPDSNIEDVS